MLLYLLKVECISMQQAFNLLNFFESLLKTFQLYKNRKCVLLQDFPLREAHHFLKIAKIVKLTYSLTAVERTVL